MKAATWTGCTAASCSMLLLAHQAEGRAMNKEAVQMFATPAERILKDFVEFGDTGFAGHEQSPPYQRTHAAEYYAKLIDCKGRYRSFRHANSLPNPTGAVLNLTPGNLPLSKYGRQPWIRSGICPGLARRRRTCFHYRSRGPRTP